MGRAETARRNRIPSQVGQWTAAPSGVQKFTGGSLTGSSLELPPWAGEKWQRLPGGRDQNSMQCAALLGKGAVLAPRLVELFLHPGGTVADRFDNLLQVRRRDIELPGPCPDLPAVLHIDLRPVGLNGLGQPAHRCALAIIARENRVTAKANDTSSASRSSFFFRLGRFCAIDKMTDERPKGSGVTIRA